MLLSMRATPRRWTVLGLGVALFLWVTLTFELLPAFEFRTSVTGARFVECERKNDGWESVQRSFAYAKSRGDVEPAETLQRTFPRAWWNPWDWWGLATNHPRYRLAVYGDEDG